jgi:acetyltransferase-like isoleucine patch superfamily enzyme
VKSPSSVKTKEHYPNYPIGEYTYGRPYIFKGHPSLLEIGKFCSFAPEVLLLVGAEHDHSHISTYPFGAFPEEKDFNREDIPPTGPLTKGKLTIGNDVWVGSRVTIMSGLTIGDGAVIGAGSVVTRDVSPYTIVAGNPARVIKDRFSPFSKVKKLLEMKWWDWDKETIKNNLHLIKSSDIDALYKIFKKEIKC